MSDHIDCPRCCPPPMRNPRAELAAALLILAGCIGWLAWYANAGVK